MAKKRQVYSAGFREEAVKSVIDSSRPVAQVARELGIVEQTLGNWGAAYRRDHAGDEPELTAPERARLRDQERELRELRMEVEFLKRAAAYFAKDAR